MGLVKQIFDIGYFGRALRVQLRFGELSRSPLRLLRLNWEGSSVECDWTARAADEWGQDLPHRVNQANASTQALKDAIDIRELLFSALPGVDRASLKVFREAISGELELMITGAVIREQESFRNVSSLAMRAKLLGFRFWLEDGVLETLRPEECALSF